VGNQTQDSSIKNQDGSVIARRDDEAISTDKYYLWSGSYVGNSLLFWRQGKAGYTTDLDKAHQFYFDEALEIQKGSNGDHKMIPVSHCNQIATKQVHADHLDRRLVGKELQP
tara:strand:+ start:1027 stop:1362 length:336 start_codon:yes stop_codon:yes gene_type:complete